MKSSRTMRRGFTLLEVTLAMAMVSVLAASLYSAMSVVLRARRSLGASIEPTRAVTIAGEIIGRDFESVLAPTGVLAGPFIGYHQSGTTGDSDTVQFYSIGEDHTEGPLAEGIRRVELAVRDDTTPPVLVRRVTRNLLATAEPVPDEEMICRDVRSFSLRYFDGLTWQDNWDSTTLGDVLPAAVEITIETGSASDLSPLSETPRRITRIIPLACSKPIDDSSAGGGG